MFNEALRSEAMHRDNLAGTGTDSASTANLPRIKRRNGRTAYRLYIFRVANHGVGRICLAAVSQS